MMSYKALLKRKDFSLFLCTQFLGAFNDNLYRMVVSLLIVQGAMSGEPLSIAAMIFMIPYLFFSGYAGFLADRYSKRKVMIVVRSLSIITMFVALFALHQQNTLFMLAVLCAMATEAVFFSPAKFGILPEAVSLQELSRANGLLQTSTYIAIILGGVLGGFLVSFWGDALLNIGVVLITIAVISALCSLGIPRTASASTRNYSLNPFAEISLGFKQFFQQHLLFWVIMAVAYFWSLGLALQVNLVAWGHITLNWTAFEIALMQAILAIGIGAGSLLAGKLSGDQIEPGMIPLGALLMAVCLLWMAEPTLSQHAIYLLLFALGVSAGLYIVPLNALLQELPAKAEKGRMIATSNFVSALGMLLASIITWVFYKHLQLNPLHLFLIFGGFTFILFIFAFKVFPEFFVRFVIFIITHTFYRVHLMGYHNLPKTGPALLVCNHVSYMDGLMLTGTVPRFIRYLIYKDIYEKKLLNWIFKLGHAIPVKEGEYNTVMAAFANARESLREGHIVCIFAEGMITRTGQLLPFRKGFEKIMEGMTDVPIIPVYIDALWNTLLVSHDGNSVWRILTEMPFKATIAFGEPMPANSNANEVRQTVQELAATVKFCTKDPRDTLSRRLLHKVKTRYFRFCMTDPIMPRLTYGQFIGRALLLARYLRTNYADEKYIGIMLAPTVQSAMVNVAVTLAGFTAINFPYQHSHIEREYFIEKSGVKVILSTRKLLQAINETPPKQIVYYEDLHFIAKQLQRKIAGFAAFWLPVDMVLKMYGRVTETDDAAAICFSRGNKVSMQGALLSHSNIITNIQAYSYVLHVKRKDRIMGVLSFAGAYGYSLTLWLPLLNGMAAAYHPDPTSDYEKVGRMMSQHKTTIIFDRADNYLKYIDEIRPSRFSYIRAAIVAGDPLPDVLARAFFEKFALELLDSYGCVEMGPGIAMNVPDVRHPGLLQRGSQPGSVGRPLPGFAIKIVDRNTFKPVEVGQEGLLLVRGLGMMLGYLGEDRATRAVLHDGWYVTGDIFMVNTEGFLFYRGRI
ncbi:MAG: MFS transporter [Gammaproteobacteria bacterium]|jgi:acyl-[acyl-carrier-protein]-phospholipid O-acyltransferase/long-chain-fatty-acid--[acyl-carrier-protein] ligase